MFVDLLPYDIIVYIYLDEFISYGKVAEIAECTIRC
jgi:hypothetical protein